MYLGEQMFFPSWQCCKLFFLPLNTIKLLRQHAPNRGRAAFQLRQTILGYVWAQKRHPRNFGYNSDFTAVFNVIFKTSI